jgi:23S rRNA pseudouridine1911/1915/1917 synthase
MLTPAVDPPSDPEPLHFVEGPDTPIFRALDKPAGRTVLGSRGLYSDVTSFLGIDWHLVHRLDRMTSGVLLLARGKAALRLAHDAWPTQVEKTYLTRVRGVVDPPDGVIAAPILENRSSRPDLLLRALRAAYGEASARILVTGVPIEGIPPIPSQGRSVVHSAGRHAVTRYHLVEKGPGWSLLEVILETGRMHQIRVHLAHLGAPILSDPLYDPGAQTAGTIQPWLHAARLRWFDPPGFPGGTVWEWKSEGSPPT